MPPSWLTRLALVQELVEFYFLAAAGVDDFILSVFCGLDGQHLLENLLLGATFRDRVLITIAAASIAIAVHNRFIIQAEEPQFEAVGFADALNLVVTEREVLRTARFTDVA